MFIEKTYNQKMDKTIEVFSKELTSSLSNLKKSIYNHSNEEFNIDSPKQLGEILFGKLILDTKAKKTKTGQYKTDESTLSKLEGSHPIVVDILNYRTQKKLLSTYVDALPKLISNTTHRIHTSYMQTVTSTGRLSSNKPNLQNIPIRTELGKEIRKAFCSSSEKHFLLCADYSQIELRIIAGLSKDDSMINAFTIGRDIHTETASKIFKVGLDKVSREMRGKAKMVNFGIIYGISQYGLAKQINVSNHEADEFLNAYFLKFPEIKIYMDNTIKFCRKSGYVNNIFGRRSHFNGINDKNFNVRNFQERAAINAPIQGSASEIMRLAMIRLDKKLSDQKNIKSKMLLQIHDELIFEVPKNNEKIMIKLIKDEMTSVAESDYHSFSTPLTVDINIGDNWGMLH